jgi:mRNA interferase HigB
MKVVGRQSLTDFMDRHADARESVVAWIAEVEKAAWKGPNEVKARYASASFLPNNEVVFNLKGNRYRLKVIVAYAAQSVVVLKVGTHAEYNRW